MLPSFPPALLALADGTLFHGIAIGHLGHTVGEVVFNTAPTGYQEILTDPSYAQQIVTLTYPHIGNVGINHEDLESQKIQTAGLIIRDLPILASNFRHKKTLQTYLQEENIVGISGIDTRQLTRILRDKGAQSGCIQAGHINAEEAIQMARAFSGLAGCDLAKEVSTKSPYEWTAPVWALDPIEQQKPTSFPYKVVVIDFGVKRNILRMLATRGCHITVVPAKTSAEEILAYQPDGIMLSNGPGDPEPCDYAIATVRQLLEKRIPIFGICLGHQILALAAGAKTIKMKCGHHGANHPVKDLDSGKVLITSQNHGFAVDIASLPDTVRATHISLFDSTLQGLAFKDLPVFSFQGHPEASPGPHDLAYLFDRFISYLTPHAIHTKIS